MEDFFPQNKDNLGNLIPVNLCYVARPKKKYFTLNSIFISVIINGNKCDTKCLGYFSW